MDNNFFKKNKSLRITISLLLFIPLIIAVIYALNVDPNSVAANNLKTVTITSPQGTTHHFEDSEILGIYSSISENAKEVDENLRDFSLEKPFTITFSENNSEPLVYKLYVTANTQDFVYVSPDGKYHLISQEAAEKLITRDELMEKDLSAILPSLKAAGFGEMTELCPDSYTWTYTSANGAVSSINASSAKGENPTVKFDTSEEGALKLEFDRTPDSVTLTIQNDSNVFFNDKYENLSSANILSFNHDETLRATAVAEWYQIDGAEYYGSITYNFNLLYDILPTYNVVDKKALPTGDFTVLRMSDFNDGELLTIENVMGLPEKVKVYDLEDEDVKIAFIPFGATLETGDYTLTLKTELGQSKDVTVKTVLREEYPKQTVLINEETDKSLSDAFTKTSVQEFAELVSKYTSLSANSKLYDGKFEYPTGSAKVVSGGASYGTRREVYSLNSSGDIYISSGLDLECSDGQQITAANNGNVVFAGSTTLLGNTVIIDHGYGILSFYGNLDEISVNVGDAVTKKTSVLGKAGSTGFACAQDGAAATTSTMCHYAVSLNGVFVAPKSVYNGIFLSY